MQIRATVHAARGRRCRSVHGGTELFYLFLGLAELLRLLGDIPLQLLEVLDRTLILGRRLSLRLKLLHGVRRRRRGSLESACKRRTDYKRYVIVISHGFTSPRML